MRTAQKNRLDTLERAKELLIDLIQTSRLEKNQRATLQLRIRNMSNALENMIVKPGFIKWDDGRLVIPTLQEISPITIYMDSNLKQPEEHIEFMKKQIYKMKEVSVALLRTAFPTWRVTFS